MKTIDEQTLVILSLVTIDKNMIFLTCGAIPRKQYLAVNEILEHMGGKWSRKLKAHLFDGDPTEALEQVLLTGEITPPKSYGYFPTPPDIAQRIIELAEIKPGMTVLEPSAGQGALAGPAAQIVGAENVDCCELLEENCTFLVGDGLQVVQGDFLSMQPVARYARVVMNPPFRVEGRPQADIDHVLHAWSFVSPRGRLVAIMSAGVLFRENRKTVEFRELVNEHGYMERLPDGSFKESGTGVNACVVVMDRPR